MAAALGEVPDAGGRWQLPKGWRWRRAKDFARVIGGGTPRNAADPFNYQDDGTPWITPADLSGYTRSTISRGRRSLSVTGLASSSARLLPKRTVLISSRAPVGYCAVADTEVTTNQGFRSLVCGDTIDPFFIRYYVLYSRRYLEESASGTTFKELSGTALGELLFPIPPLETQRRIVARIDELFSELDDGEEELRRARGELGTYRKSLLKAAVTAELTADWRAANPPKETGAELLQRILADRRARWGADPKNKGKGYKEPKGPDLDHAADLPPGWAWASYEQCFETLSDGGLKIKERDYLPAGRFPVVDQGAKSVAGYSDDETMVQPVDRPWILFGDHTRRFKFVDQPFCIGADGIKLIRPDAQLSTRYLWRVLQGSHFENRGYSRHFQFVRALNIPLAPIGEQEQIVALVAELLGGADELSHSAREAEETDTETLRRSILAAAFQGELVQ